MLYEYKKGWIWGEQIGELVPEVLAGGRGAKLQNKIGIIKEG